MSRTEIEWSYSPAEFFEASITVRRGGVVLNLAHGVAKATVEGRPPEMREFVAEATCWVVDLLRGPQLVEFEPFTLSAGNVAILGDDGSRGVMLLATCAVATARGGRVDLRYCEPNGTVRDTRQERIDRKRIVSERIARHRPVDRPLQRIVRSLDAAVRDPDDELVHLYEVLEAVKSRMSDRDLRIAVDPKDRRWREFKSLCNDAPVLQGRHRGERVDVDLRPATDDELKSARAYAVFLTESYLEWLDRCQTPP